MSEALEEITGVFDKGEVALILACGVRKYQEYQVLKGKREDKDIISYRQFQKKIQHQQKTLMEVIEGYKYRYPGGYQQSTIHADQAGGGRGGSNYK